MTKPGSDRRKLPAEKDEEASQEVTASLAADATVGVWAKLDGDLKEQRAAPKDFLGGKDFYALLPTGFSQSLVKHLPRGSCCLPH